MYRLPELYNATLIGLSTPASTNDCQDTGGTINTELQQGGATEKSQVSVLLQITNIWFID